MIRKLVGRLPILSRGWSARLKLAARRLQRCSAVCCLVLVCFLLAASAIADFIGAYDITDDNIANIAADAIAAVPPAITANDGGSLDCFPKLIPNPRRQPQFTFDCTKPYRLREPPPLSMLLLLHLLLFSLLVCTKSMRGMLEFITGGEPYFQPPVISLSNLKFTLYS